MSVPCQLIESGMQKGRVYSLTKWFLAVVSQSNHWTYPRRPILRITTSVKPQNSAPFVCQLLWECTVQAREPVRHELLYLRIA
jgi:hypothetical protein